MLDDNRPYAPRVKIFNTTRNGVRKSNYTINKNKNRNRNNITNNKIRLDKYKRRLSKIIKTEMK